MLSWLDRWREYFLTWYDEGGVEDKAREAADFACRYLDGGVVSVSGGKDSMAMLHIVVSRCRGDVDVFHWDHGAALMPRRIEDEILRNIGAVAPKARLVVRRYSLGGSERARVDWRPWYDEFFATLEKLGYKHHVLGIRAEESSRRRGRGRVVDRGRWTEVHPIYHFTWRDVWAYIFKHGVPVPQVYYIYARHVGWDRARLTTFHDKEFEKYGNQIDGVLMWREKNYVERKNSKK
jgi:predicted phosphoadenosine phosphosulfate sulfurtransferase